MVKDRFIYTIHPPVDSSSAEDLTTDRTRRREQLRRELQCVIESMGPCSPQLQSSSFDADNENSTTSLLPHDDSKEDYTLSLITTSIESTNVAVKANKATSPCLRYPNNAGEPSCPCFYPPCNYCFHHLPQPICACPSNLEWLKGKSSKPDITKKEKEIKPSQNSNREKKEIKSEKNEKFLKINNPSLNRTAKKAIYYDGNTKRRVEFYYFDHGNAQYFNTTDSPPVMLCEILAEKTENYTTKFWAEIFGSFHIFFSFITSFIIQFIRFILYSMIRPLTVGLMQLISDYFFKPFLTTLFNAFIQPPLIFLYNCATSIRDLLDPIAEGVGYFFRELSILFKSIRVCCIKNNNDNNQRYDKKDQQTTCDNI